MKTLDFKFAVFSVPWIGFSSVKYKIHISCFLIQHAHFDTCFYKNQCAFCSLIAHLVLTKSLFNLHVHTILVMLYFCAATQLLWDLAYAATFSFKLASYFLLFISWSHDGDFMVAEDYCSSRKNAATYEEVTLSALRLAHRVPYYRPVHAARTGGLFQKLFVSLELSWFTFSLGLK